MKTRLSKQLESWGDWRVLLLGLTGFALSLASGFTTWDGMSQFTSSPVLSALITFGIQGVMLICAFIIGQVLVKGLVPTLKNIPLLLAFVLCMATSVFFSFDSLFRQILPPEARKTNAAIRMQSEVPDLVQDVTNATARERARAVTILLGSDEWRSYEKSLQTLVNLSEDAKDEIKAQEIVKLKRIENQRGKTEASIATTAIRIGGIENRIKANEAQRKAIDLQLPAIRSTTNRLEATLRLKEQAIIKEEERAKAEATGVGGSQQKGRGPKYRAIQKEIGRLSLERETLLKELEANKNELQKKENEQSQLLGELEVLNTQRSQLKGRKKTAEQELTFNSDNGKPQIRNSFEGAAAVLPESRDAFRQSPTRANFVKVQSNCQVLLAGLASQPKFESKVATMTCEPKQAIAMAQELFALDAGVKNLSATCAPQKSTSKLDAEALIARGQRCLETSGLSGEPARPFRNRLKTLKLERDDKASSFVVTINSFLDRNWLAYLALGIAVAIDLLVFLSGIFSARVAETNAQSVDFDALAEPDALKSDQFSDLRNALKRPGQISNLTAHQIAERFQLALHPDTRRSGFSYRIPISETNAPTENTVGGLEQSDREIVRKLIGIACGLKLAELKGNENTGTYWVDHRFINLIHRMLEKPGKEQTASYSLTNQQVHAHAQAAQAAQTATHNPAQAEISRSTTQAEVASFPARQPHREAG